MPYKYKWNSLLGGYHLVRCLFLKKGPMREKVNRIHYLSRLTKREKTSYWGGLHLCVVQIS